jgi:serine/tyrosine/threonine adenylyltransferase
MFPFDNSYALLPDRFYAKLRPTPVAGPKLIRLNEALAIELGLDPARLASPEGVAVLAGSTVPAGADPLAAAYAGHQFGNFTPQLGDGRAILLGEVIDRAGKRRDIQLKGSGPTPFSRRGDGRAALGPVLREYVLSEAFAALGIPTTRALAAVMTGEEVWRDTPMPGAVFTRVAASHIRVGTFQYFAARGDVDAIKTLVDHVVARHFPEAAGAPNKYRALLDAVIAKQATLIAQWLCVGFIHGVMNTDNMSIAGETIDFGPCAFMDTFHPGMVYSSIDHAGRYAYANQPRIAQWNLARLAETLLPLFDDDKDAAVAQAQASIGAFYDQFQAAYTSGFRAKLGLLTAHDGDLQLAQDLLQCMADGEADFTLTFRWLTEAVEGRENAARLRAQFNDPTAFDAWAAKWSERLLAEGGDPVARAAVMRAANPAFIPRNHLVEEVIQAGLKGDFAPFERLIEVLSKPFEDQPDAARFTLPPEPEQVVHQTFCGT